MLEGLAAWVLNNYLGKYVEILNTDQLSVALLKGAVELENLPLRKNALRNLGLPVEIKSGFIGKIKLQIPVRQIRSAPWVIIIEQLYLVASPLSVEDWNAASEEVAANEIKLNALDKLEAQWRLENDCQDNNSSYYASSYSSWLSYGTGVITDIVENLQLKIRDVHIRYEDNVSIEGKSIAFGLTVDSLSAQSCDTNWQPGFSHWSSSEMSFKLLEMQTLAVYWMDLNESQRLANMNLGELAVAMSQNQSTKYSNYYILAPVSAQAHIKRNRSELPLRTSDNPRIFCDLSLDEVPLSLVDWQYDQIVKCTRGLDRITTLRRYKRYKPTCSISEDARAWWLYAISCLDPGRQPAICRAKPTWESCSLRAKQNVEYVRVYTKILTTPTAAILPDEKKLKDTVEFEREFEELKILREIAMKQVPIQKRNENANSSAGRSMLVSWFPTWMGWYSSSTNDSTSASTPETMQLEGEILQALSDTVENNTILKRDVVFGQFKFTLKSGILNLCTTKEGTEENSPMLELQFKNLSVNIVSKPRTSSHLVELSLGGVYLCDKITLNSLFPVLVGPPGQERITTSRNRGVSPRINFCGKTDDNGDSLFYLAYEKKPENSPCDYRLSVKSKCLDVVYQPNAVRWLTEFLCLPHQRNITHSRIEAMKSRTKKEFIKNWEQILDGRAAARSSWELKLDISAPQIIFVEQFCDPNSSVAVIDFGRLQLQNNPNTVEIVLPKQDFILKESEDDEMFVTPCSTPPVSEEDSLSQSTKTFIAGNFQNGDDINETSLHQKLYDIYLVELTDLQILIGKVKDNWRYAHNKGTSTLHILDRFNISLQIERRVVHTCDPSYPSLTLSANLPKLVAHVNENKISTARNLAQVIYATGLPSPFNAPDSVLEVPSDERLDDDESYSYDTSIEMSRLLMLQFTVDHMSLEVQSRGRSVAELQVAGVKLAFTKRPMDIAITLSVHSLLLVDALQTFGPDFELLVASHKHVGMDSMSGSLRDSEPTSPTSPGSPDPTVTRASATSPVALTQALSTLASSTPIQPQVTNQRTPFVLDAEALITIEVVLVTSQEPMQIANIQFNNLDIIANQETIVELMGFIRRVFPDLKTKKPSPLKFSSVVPSNICESSESLLETQPQLGNTELTFDFHRLNVLLLRGMTRDGIIYGKKICTATMSEAKIQATFGSTVKVEGSLGGLQILDLTPEGHMHQRIVSVGRDPLLEAPHPLYTMSHSLHDNERKAFSFQFLRKLEEPSDDNAEITVRMASLWYTHSPQFVLELQSCATEFKQYLANLARSIRSAATDMALGLVHARAEALAQSIYMNSRLSASIYGSALSLTDLASPRKRRRSSSMEPTFSGYSSVRDTTVPQTPYSPTDYDEFIINIRLDIILDSPVLVLPRANNSPQVFVAHLGKINISNKYPKKESQINGNGCEFGPHIEHYNIEVRDMNLFSLDTSSRRVPGPMISKPETLYCCQSLAKPVLHNTIVQLMIEREITRGVPSRHQSESNLLLEEEENINQDTYSNENIQITGSIVSSLKVSLTRSQYEQVLDTVQWHMSAPTTVEQMLRSRGRVQPTLSDISEEDTGVTTLNMDPHMRAKLFPTVPVPKNSAPKSFNTLKVAFDIPVLTIELRGDSPTGEQGLVDLSFREFVFIYEKGHRYETNIQVSLRSILMEDLLQPEDSKQRAMVISSCSGELPVGSSCFSRSCPDMFSQQHMLSPSRGSLPDHLEPTKVFGVDIKGTLPFKGKITCPNTPPPSPRTKTEKNLVLISTLLVDPSAPNFNSFYNSVQRSTSVDFNCLDLVVSVESWVVVIDFFSASSSANTNNSTGESRKNISGDSRKDVAKENAETNISIRSLTVVLVQPDRDVAKANISHVDLVVKTSGLNKQVEGRLGSMSLSDLTLYGQLYRERFVTSGKQALHFNYIRCAPKETSEYDAQLRLEMSSVMYIHTKRFVAEVQAFFNHFTQLQAFMRKIRAATSGQLERDEPLRLSLVLKAEAPIILLPVSSKSTDLLIADLGRLLVTNCFKYSGDAGTISVVNNTNQRNCLLDVMQIELQNMDLYAGMLGLDDENNENFRLGEYTISKRGPSLLTEKCHVKLQVEHNLDNGVSHNVPDMSIHGELSTLDGSLDLSQYKLIRGLLMYNLGEDTEIILPSVSAPEVTAESNIRDVWILSSFRFDLSNVTVRLQLCHDSSPLACINFIKSRLTIETLSNFSQDIDLISQEILILDTRFEDFRTDKRPNVFTNILLPINYMSQNDLVQAEVHSRKRHNHVKFTVLLNNMRLMAIFDWWEAILDFILSNSEDVQVSPTHHANKRELPATTLELKLNITDSEIVVVEDRSQWDTNAVILKSTTVITYRPSVLEKPLSCSLNNCEMFSCILGMEDETALSIIDPITLNMEINKENILEVHLHLLTIRLSYHDMHMFIQMLNSLPKQMFTTDKKSASKELSSVTRGNLTKLKALGFKSEDCILALSECNQKLDDAALWLTQNASPVHEVSRNKLKAVEVKANCISLCIIDDCGDADVPLLEVSLSDLNLSQCLSDESQRNDKSNRGALECILTSDYYNRVLSGWEPVIEPWKCLVMWNQYPTSDLARKRLKINIESNESLNINITSTLMDLYKMVRENWVQDFYSVKTNNACKQVCSPMGYKRRSPFVPFALKNDTGSVLYFTTLITDMDRSFDAVDGIKPDEKWVMVRPGDTIPFAFKSRDKLRHRDSHKAKMHQLAVKVVGWHPITPVTVDQVGVYFRHATAELSYRNQEVPPARIVFDVALEGSARKLVTVRSALLLINRLTDSVEIKLESQLPHDTFAVWAPSKCYSINSGVTMAIPLVHAHSLISIRPTNSQFTYTFCSPHISWNSVTQCGDNSYESRACHTHRGHNYRFCAEIRRENYPADRSLALGSSSGQWIQPAHTIILLPTVLLVNLLPIDLNYSLANKDGRVSAGCEASVTYVDTDKVVELGISCENFPASSVLVVPANCVTGFTCRLKLTDSSGRKLLLQAVIAPHTDAKLKITISAPYWIINKTGLPMVFRQSGVNAETAGQFAEHEVARMITPLLFSFSDQEASPTVTARVGTHVIADGSPQWCQHFHLKNGIQVRKLHVTLRDGRPDIVFVIGIEVRVGRGKYRSTHIVTISPRYQLHNKSSYQLLFAQSCFATNLSDPSSQKTYLKAMPDCHMPFHWPRLEKPQLLCVLIQNIPDCCWSGGLRIDMNYSMHVNVRDANSRVYFLRLEVILQGATFFIIFTDADTMPPPIRVDNFSEVPITFSQSCCKDVVHSTARAHSSVPYAWDQPTKPQLLTIIVPGGVSSTFDLNKLGAGAELTYENFIYIAFTGTFKNGYDPLDIESQELVLDVVNNTQVVLARKRHGLRSQLWRMTSVGQLQHEGSSPPSHPQQLPSENILVLDIEGPAPQPSTYSRLVLRRPDMRRQSTQTWRFTDEGRLCCAHNNMCVQAQDGFFGLRQGKRSSVACWQRWSAAVLGLPQPVCHQVTDTGIPIEQAVSRQRLRPGSGFLSVEINTDGPTRVLSIWDMKEKHRYATSDEKDWCSVSLKQRPNLSTARDEDDFKNHSNNDLQLTVHLAKLGISLVAHKPPQELLFANFSNIVSETVIVPTSKQFCISVEDIQFDNQLFDAPVPVVLYVTPPNSRSVDDAQSKLPTLDVKAEMQPIMNENAVIFKHFIVKLKKLTITLEEKLLLKLFSFIGFNSKEEELVSRDETDYETQRMLTEVAGANARRYYFGIIQLVPDQIRLSMKTASKLPAHLLAIKRKLGLTLIKFEDAAVDLEPFVKQHPFETIQFLFNSILKHFKDELMWQAGIILGSVDFLGNPLGLMNDVSEGFSGLIYEGSVGALFKNVTHGLSNSAAKVTESLSDGLGRVTMDDEHEEMRQKIRHVDTGRSKDHIYAGIKGLGFGILGGATGIFKQVYEGASNEGIQGVFSGIGKGLVGAVTKPVVGVLDLASETARAVRDSSRSSSHMMPERARPPRCVFGPGGLLPRYSFKQSLGQQYLYLVNNRNYNEQLVAYECLRSGSEDLRVIVSNQRVRIVTSSTDDFNLATVIESHLSDLESCKPVSEKEGSETRYYIEITMHVTGTSVALVYQDPIKRPRVRCDSVRIARAVSQQLNYAKRLYNEGLHTLTSDNINNNED